MFNHGIGIHLLKMEITPAKTGVINPKDNHISFQCAYMDLIILKLQKMGINYVTAVVKEGGVEVNQLFFHDPDGYMIEIFHDETSYSCGEDEVWMMDNLLIDVMGISF
ncbi:putative glyoxalase/Bleomycin resistance protein/Dihydroxybiphenyl dioxygenase [Helianthus annuus]|nr:putative glyoxalase/Bleomycin resistance protein/Dihydroxybiphenyl dioxygenase [Helianthus annuus]